MERHKCIEKQCESLCKVVAVYPSSLDVRPMSSSLDDIKKTEAKA
jgi:hypothetical protein